MSEAAFLACLSAADADELDFGFIVRSKVEPEWRCDERTIDEHVLYYVVSGRIGGIANGKEVSVGHQEVMWTPPQVLHSYRLLEETTTYSMRFRLRVGGDLPAPFSGVQLLRKAIGMAPVFDRVYRVAQQDSTHSFFRLKAALVDLAATVLERLGDDSRTRGRTLSKHQWNRLEAFLEQEMHYAPSPADLARVLGWNPDYFARRFREDLGISPREWLTRERLQRAAFLLMDSHLPIGEVAERTGYSDQRFFSRQFRSRYGCTPSTYRQQH